MNLLNILYGAISIPHADPVCLDYAKAGRQQSTPQDTDKSAAPAQTGATCPRFSNYNARCVSAIREEDEKPAASRLIVEPVSVVTLPPNQHTRRQNSGKKSSSIFRIGPPSPRAPQPGQRPLARTRMADCQ